MAEDLGYEEVLPGSHIWLVKKELEFYIPGWYFSDETEQFVGPFDTKEKAEQELGEYWKWLDQPSKAALLVKANECVTGFLDSIDAMELADEVNELINDFEGRFPERAATELVEWFKKQLTQ